MAHSDRVSEYNIKKLEELQKFIQDGSVEANLCVGVNGKIRLFSNGFIIEYSEARNSYHILNIKNQHNSRYIPDVRSVFEYITEKFFLANPVNKDSITAIIFRRYNINEINNAVNKLRKKYKLKGELMRSIKDALKNGKFKTDAAVAREIISLIKNMAGDVIVENITIREARQKCLELIPDFGSAELRDTNKDTMIENQMSVRDFMILNIFFSYPVLFYYLYVRRKKYNIIPLSCTTDKISSVDYSDVVDNKMLRSDFWAFIRHEKNVIFKRAIETLQAHQPKWVELTGKNRELMDRLSEAYKIPYLSGLKGSTE